MPALSDLESRAIWELVLRAVAHKAGRCYPTVLTRSSVLVKIGDKKAQDSDLQCGVRELLAAFFPMNLATSKAVRPLRAEAAHLEINVAGESEFRLRTYVALTEGYNYCCNRWLLASREWLDPWGTWGLFIPRPLWQCEVDFLNVVAAMSGTSYELLRDEVEANSVTILSTIIRITAAMQDIATCQPVSGADKLGARFERLAETLRGYIGTGELRLRRTWRRYELLDFA